jgi:two-component system, OmpR family, sensor kinase
MTVSLRTRLTVWYALTLGVGLSLFSILLLRQQERLGFRRVDRELSALGATAASVLADELRENPEPRAAALDLIDTFTTPGRLLVVTDAGRSVLAANWNGLAPQPIQPIADAAPRVWTVVTNGASWRLHAQAETLGSTRLLVVVGMPLADLQREQAEAREAMVIGLPIALLLAAGGGLWLATIGLRPIAEMAAKAARLPPTGEEDLGRPARSDELGRLALAFNGLVARLRATLATQRQFMADASHELRTPVAVVQTTADVTLSRAHRGEAEYRDAIAVMGGEARRLGRLVEDMLVLARADAGAYPIRMVDLYIDEIVAECARTFEVVAQQRGVRLVVQTLPEMELRGDEDLLRRLIVNVLQNAIQHTARDGAIVISAERAGDRALIRMADGGAGIPDADRERIFQRFVQLDPSRRSVGVGLGLPIASWIAHVHGGELALEASGSQGSTFRITLPLRMSGPEPPDLSDGAAIA